MEEREPDLPVATLRPGRLQGRLASTRGDLARWVRDKRRAIDGRSLPLILTGVVFSGMMFAMGHVADRAQRAGAAIDELHREQNEWMSRQEARHDGMLFHGNWTLDDPWGAHATAVGPEADLEPNPGAGAATTAVGRNAALFYIVAGE